MKLKRVLALVMVMVMLVGMTACGGSDESDVRGEIKNETETDDNQQTENETEDKNGADTDTDVEEVELSLGKASGKIYESEFMGIGWTLPENWAFMTDEELKEMNSAVIDMLGEDIGSQLEAGTTFCDMSAYNLNGDTVNIQIEKLAPSTALLVGEAEYADLSDEQLIAAFEEIGYTTTVETSTMMLGGEEHVSMDVTLSYEGVTIYERMGLIKVGQYMCVVTAASTDIETVEAIFDNFYALD